MRRAWRIIWRLGLIVALALTATVVSARWWLPGYLSARVVNAAEDAGLGPAEVGGVRFGWTWVEVIDLRLGDGRLVLPSVVAAFSPLDLLRGQVDEVHLSDAQWTIRVAEGAVDWAPLQALSSGGGGGPLTLPFDRVVLEGLRLRFELPEEEVVLPVWAQLVVPPRASSAIVSLSLREPAPALDRWELPRTPPTDPFAVTATVDLPTSTLTSVGVAARHHLAEGDGLTRVLEAWSGLVVRGQLEAAGGVQRSGTPHEPFALRWEKGEVRDPDGVFSVLGLEVVIELWGLGPWSSPPGQVLRWQEARLGEMVATDGEVRFAVHPSGALHVEEAAWRIDEGRFVVSSFEVDLASPDISARLSLQHVSLNRWLSLVSMGHVTGEGRVSGELAFRVATEPRLRFAFGEGEVSADGPGVLSVVDLREAESFVRERELISLDELDYGAEVRDRIVEALGAFAYDLLRFRFEREEGTGDVVMRLMTKGQGLRGAKQPFERLTVNVAGVNELVDEALRQKLGLDRLRERWDRRVRSAAEPGSQGDEP